MISRVTTSLALGALALAIGACSSQTSDQVVSGQLSLSSFPANVTTVRAVQGGVVVVEQPVAADGRFSLALPPGSGYRIEFATDSSSPTLVFPRQAGTIDSSFTVAKGGAPFDLGMVHYIGDPATHNYAYGPGPSSDGDNSQCEDGIDPNTGDVCVDDNDDEGASCGNDTGDSETADGTDTGDSETADGTDTGDGEATDGTDTGDGETADGTDNADTPGDAAVADHNLPSSVGCGGETDGDNVQCEDGVDATTGLPCDNNDTEDGSSGE